MPVPRSSWITCGVLLFLPTLTLPGDDYDQKRVGVQPDGSVVVPTNQVLTPAGQQLLFPGRPVDLCWGEEGELLVKNQRDLVVIDMKTRKIRQTLAIPRQGRTRIGFSVVGMTYAAGKVYATDARDHLRIARRNEAGQYAWEVPIKLTAPAVGGEAHGAGVAWQEKGKLLWVASTRGNCLQLVNVETRTVETVVPVGVAPFMVTVDQGPNLVFVSNWGGDPPKQAEPQAESSKTPIRIDPRTGVADDGSVSVVSLVDGKWRQSATIKVGLHPSGMLLRRNRLYVANANSDTISVIDIPSQKVIETISCRMADRLPFGSGANAVLLSQDLTTLYVANGTNNAVAVISLSRQSMTMGRPSVSAPPVSRLEGFIPTGWYPGALTLTRDGKTLCVANIKGHGSLSQPRPAIMGMNSHDHLGTVSLIPVPDANTLARHTEQVKRNNRYAYSIAGLDKPRPNIPPKPMPERHGEPSVFKHVIYIIKENRTYDQVFGDMKEGKGNPMLTLFGENVTPNHHALARQFVLLDNFYCSGVLSADGHSWTNEAYVTDYLERSFGGFTRSYPDDGSDPLAYPATGFLWDNALRHGKTLRNYGEFTKVKYTPEKPTWSDVYADYVNGTRKVKIEVKANLKTLEPHTHTGYPWFPLITPDVYRAKLFLDDLKEFEKKGAMPNLIYLTLPCDHTDGTRPGFPTPRAMVADNDLALGMIVEGVTKSKFWPHTCIFVVEDDPQDGFDHVDAHRTVALCISPYTKRRAVDSTNYNQTGMVKSIELILGLPPMNQLDLAATPMRGCFTDQPDLTPYACLPNRIPLDEMNPPLERLRGKALHWAKVSLALNLDEGDKADEETLNRILWHAVKGDGVPYPLAFTRRGRGQVEQDDQEEE
jgi:YVTN family beta-propeller protein